MAISATNTALTHRCRYCTMVVLLGMLTGACGYQFAGSGKLPGGVNNVFVAVLDNRTNETGVENIVTNDLINEFTLREQAASKQEANGILTGQVSSISISNIARSGESTITQRRVRMRLRLKLTRPDGKIIWRAKRISGDQTYDVGEDRAATDRNRRDAIRVLSRRMAQVVYSRMTGEF